MARLENENYERTITVAEQHEDLKANDWVVMFYGAMVTATFSPQGVLEAMRDFADDHLENDFTDDEQVQN